MKILPSPVLAFVCSFCIWVVMKTSLGLMAALGWLRTQKKPNAFIRWLEEGFVFEGLWIGDRILVGLADVVALAFCNAVVLILLVTAGGARSDNEAVTAVFYLVEAAWFMWLGRYVWMSRKI